MLMLDAYESDDDFHVFPVFMLSGNLFLCPVHGNRIVIISALIRMRFH